MNETYVSDFLFARPSFLEGCARLFDFADALNIYNTSRTPKEADGFAIWTDWNMIGQDLRAAILAFEDEYEPVVLANAQE